MSNIGKYIYRILGANRYAIGIITIENSSKIYYKVLETNHPGLSISNEYSCDISIAKPKNRLILDSLEEINKIRVFS